MLNVLALPERSPLLQHVPRRAVPCGQKERERRLAEEIAVHGVPSRDHHAVLLELRTSVPRREGGRAHGDPRRERGPGGAERCVERREGVQRRALHGLAVQPDEEELRAHPQPVHVHLLERLRAGAERRGLHGEGDRGIVFLLRRRRDARRIDDGSNRRSGYYGFRMQFPATYNREFFTTSQQECQDWVNVIRDMTEVRKIEDYYDIREKIGEGRFATVYRVGMERGVE